MTSIAPADEAAYERKAGRRWSITSALGVAQIFAWGSSYYLLTALAKPIAADTGWSMDWIIGALSLGLLVSGAVSPHVGRAIGRHGGRPVLAAACLLQASGLVLLGVATSMPVYIAAWLVLGLAMGAGLYDAAFATLGRLYGVDARKAITTLTLWGGFASTVCWPLSAYLADHVGWRATCFIYAATQLLVCLPLVLGVLPAMPRSTARASRPVAAPALSRTQQRAFLLLSVVFVLGGITTSVVAVHLLSLLQARGLTLAAAVSLGAIMGPSQVSARLIEMVSGGRHHPLWTLLIATSSTALGLVLLAAGAPIVALSVVLYGAGNGIYSIARGAVPLVLFGPDAYPWVIGRLARPALFAAALAPSLGALVITRLGPEIAWSVLAGLAIVNVALVCALWRFTEPSTGYAKAGESR
jgi:predicted MFS family arabinose efflux permease